MIRAGDARRCTEMREERRQRTMESERESCDDGKNKKSPVLSALHLAHNLLLLWLAPSYIDGLSITTAAAGKEISILPTNLKSSIIAFSRAPTYIYIPLYIYTNISCAPADTWNICIYIRKNPSLGDSMRIYRVRNGTDCKDERERNEAFLYEGPLLLVKSTL